MIQTFSATLTQKNQITPEIYILTLDLLNEELVFAAGQYIILKVPQPHGEYARRLYSIASSPQLKQQIELVIKRIPGGLATAYIDELSIGSEVLFDAPAGVFTLKSPPGRNVVFLATNTGITPFRSMILDEMSGGLKREIRAFWGMKQYKDLYYHEEFKNMALNDPKFHYTVCLSRDAAVYDACISRRIDEALTKDILPALDAAAHDFYICGGVSVIDTIREILLSQGIQKQHIFFEKFT